MARVRLLALLMLAITLLAASSAHSASSDLVVSQVYAGGGNAGASYTNDFVELFNPGTAPIDVAGWTIQYASAASTTWQATALSGSIAAGRHYLVQLASAAAIGASLPTPDASGATNLAVSGGKVALVRGNTALTCGASAGSCSSSPLVADLIGYGSAIDYEGAAAAPALSSTTAALRAGGGCTDTDDNSADFSETAPTPRNSSAAAAPCAAPPPPSGGVSQNAAVDIEIQPVLSISLERPSVSFGNATSGATPSSISEAVTVVSNNATGYALTVHRSAFAPADLPLAISAASAPNGGHLGTGLGGAAKVPIPVAPAADLLVGTTTAASAGSGDVWPTSLGFAGPLPVVAPGRYTATVTLTVIGR
jgi:lamin tail-like protein